MWNYIYCFLTEVSFHFIYRPTNDKMDGIEGWMDSWVDRQIKDNAYITKRHEFYSQRISSIICNIYFISILILKSIYSANFINVPITV